jgi:hypothetical protein
LPPAALPGAKLLKKLDQNFLLPFGRLVYRRFIKSFSGVKGAVFQKSPLAAGGKK